jgi:hypothetical protein
VIVVFVGGLRGVAVDVTVADDAVVGWLGGLNVRGLVAVMQVLAVLSLWWVLVACSGGHSRGHSTRAYCSQPDRTQRNALPT